MNASIVVIDQPGLQQSRILLGCVGVARDATDKAAFDLMGTLLDRRLDENLRRKHAYTYNAATSYAAWRGAGPFEAKTAVAREHTLEALREMLGELERIRTTEASPDERAGVRNQVVNRLAPQFETSLETANRLALLAVYHEPVARLGRPPTDAELTASDVRSVAAARLPPEAMRLVVVGDAAALREGLAGLGLGAPEVRASPLLSVDAPSADDED